MPDVIDPTGWEYDYVNLFKRQYNCYRKLISIAESVLHRELPEWNADIQEARKDRFKVVLTSVRADNEDKPIVFYLDANDIGSMLKPEFQISAEDFFGVNLLQDRQEAGSNDD